MNITRVRHVSFSEGERELLVEGIVGSEAAPRCASHAPVKVQIRTSGRWVTRGSGTTNAEGRFKLLVRDVSARYRAVAARHHFVDQTDSLVAECIKAADSRLHNH